MTPAAGDSLAGAGARATVQHDLAELTAALLGFSGQALWLTFWLNVALVVTVAILGMLALRALSREALERAERAERRLDAGKE